MRDCITTATVNIARIIYIFVIVPLQEVFCLGHIISSDKMLPACDDKWGMNVIRESHCKYFLLSIVNKHINIIIGALI